MKYDADGRRIQSKTVGSAITETNYIWDTTTRYGDVLLETTPNADFRTRYSYGMGELIGQKRGTDVSFTTDYYLLDGQGSVRGLTDGATGTLTQEYTYDTFGKPTSGDATKSTYLYTGQQYDSATELYSLRARYYSPQQGRFLSQDKLEADYKNPVELNRYVYTANDPINGYDPTGESDMAFDYPKAINIGFKALPSLKAVGLATLGLLAIIGAILLIDKADEVWEEVKDAYKRIRRQFVIAYAEAFVNGQVETFITTNDIYFPDQQSGFEAAVCPALRAKAKYVICGQLGRGHAEDNMIALLRGTSDLNVHQRIPVGVSKAFCPICSYMGSWQGSGQWVTIAPSPRDIMAFFAARGRTLALPPPRP
jgi:RHS repeat-associated protein